MLSRVRYLFRAVVNGEDMNLILSHQTVDDAIRRLDHFADVFEFEFCNDSA